MKLKDVKYRMIVKLKSGVDVSLNWRSTTAESNIKFIRDTYYKYDGCYSPYNSLRFKVVKIDKIRDMMVAVIPVSASETDSLNYTDFHRDVTAVGAIWLYPSQLEAVEVKNTGTDVKTLLQAAEKTLKKYHDVHNRLISKVEVEKNKIRKQENLIEELKDRIYPKITVEDIVPGAKFKSRLDTMHPTQLVFTNKGRVLQTGYDGDFFRLFGDGERTITEMVEFLNYHKAYIVKE